MTNLFETATNRVLDAKNPEYTDFQARRLVEMAGHIIMTYLLIIDASRNDMFRKSAEIYQKFAEVEVRKHATFIKNFEIDQIDKYKIG
jgi:hypothetical protein